MVLELGAELFCLDVPKTGGRGLQGPHEYVKMIKTFPNNEHFYQYIMVLCWEMFMGRELGRGD